jgi:putative hydrolase of HD superfamily
MTEHESLAKWMYEMGLLKRSPRTGWFLAGVTSPETIAEHSFRTALIGYVLAVLEGADPHRTATLCLFHDTGETRVGDVPSVGRAYVSTTPEVDSAADQVAGLPPPVAQAVRELIGDYEDRDSVEAQLAHDADKLECLLQAREYQAQGFADAEPWAISSAEAVRSASARRLAHDALEVEPKEWWRAFVEAHNSRRLEQRRHLRSIASE